MKKFSAAQKQAAAKNLLEAVDAIKAKDLEAAAQKINQAVALLNGTQPSSLPVEQKH